MSFNPFNKNFNQLKYDDLSTLIENEVSEGWTLEYKSKILKSKDIAKSIASFANSEGGWYIVGVEEKGKNNIAEKIIDIDLKKYKKPDNTINTAIKSNVKPIPTFYTKLLENPNESDKGIVVVYVEKGYDVPYLTNDGKIYCRIGESSDPDVLKDRYSFEKLMERRNEINNKLDTFKQNTIVMPTNFNNPLLEIDIFLKHDLFYFEDFHLKEFIEKLKDKFTKPVSIFDGIITENMKNMEIIPTPNSYILNFKEENNSNSFVNPTTILEIYNQGHMKFKLILPKIVNKYSYDHYYLFEELLKSEIDNLNIIDIYKLVTEFSIVINQYINFLKEYAFENNFYLSIELTNYDLSIPYFDDETLINEIFYNKIIPVNIKTKVATPYDAKFMEIENENFKFEKILVILLQTLSIPQFLIKEFILGFENYLKKMESTKD